MAEWMDQLRQTVNSTSFMYFVFVLAFFNIIGYLVLRYTNAILIFLLVSAVGSMFSQNWTIVILAAILITNTLMALPNRMGFQNQHQQEEQEPDDEEEEKILDPDIKRGVKTIKRHELEEAKRRLATNNNSNNNNNNQVMSDDGPDVTGTSTVAAATAEDDVVPMPVDTFQVGGTKKSTPGSRIDYASTMQEAYENLEQILGQGGIQKLTADTTNLMQKQKELFQAMQGMSPLLNQAKEMLSGFDMKSIQNLTQLATPVNQ
jgi:hypothetical protein